MTGALEYEYPARGPLLSIIVPVYKVEPYLHKCLDSICGQTYRNLEILLIDDGSPDHCGEICEEYAAKDSRIKVLHQENRGLSAARNAGLALATGELLGFVDSDDWIEADMYEYLFDYMRQKEADIAICSRYEHAKGRCEFRGWQEEKQLNQEEALRALLENCSLKNFMWDKLWRRELFTGVTFPVGRTFEDMAVTHRLFERARNIVCLPGAKYHYLLRSGSILDDLSLKNRMNYYLAAKSRYEDMRKNWPQFSELLAAQCVASAVGLWGGYYANPGEERRQLEEQLKEIAAFCRGHYRKALTYMEMGMSGRAVVRLTPYATWWSFALARLFSRLYRWKHGRNL